MPGWERSSLAEGTACVKVLRLRRARHCQSPERIASSPVWQEQSGQSREQKEAWRKSQGRTMPAVTGVLVLL